VQKIPASQIISISFDVIRWRLPDRLPLLRMELDLQLLDNCMGNFVLDGENIGQVTVKAVGPKMAAVLAVDKLSGDSHACPGLAHASFQDKSNSKLLTYLLHIDRLALVGEGGMTSHDEEPGDFR